MIEELQKLNSNRTIFSVFVKILAWTRLSPLAYASYTSQHYVSVHFQRNRARDRNAYVKITHPNLFCKTMIFLCNERCHKALFVCTHISQKFSTTHAQTIKQINKIKLSCEIWLYWLVLCVQLDVDNRLRWEENHREWHVLQELQYLDHVMQHQLSLISSSFHG
jgi:hypothetical protein